MKRIYTFLIIIPVFVTLGCSGGNQPTDELITVDVTKSYPKKELTLQDFMDVEYIPLETKDDFVCQDLVLDISKNLILLRNYKDDGDIYIFDRTGKGLRKINRLGKSGEEYTFYRRIVLDEENDEMFVNDQFAKRIAVFDLDGNFKRNLKRNDDIDFSHVYNFGRENLICNNYRVKDKQPFTIISKQDGSITAEIQIPFKEKKELSLEYRDEVNKKYYGATARTYNPVTPNFDNWILVEPSSDTIYRYSLDHTMTPVIVRTPTILSMEPEVFLFISFITDRYYFMEAVKKEFDFIASVGYPAKDLMYDKQEKAIFKYTVYNNDYTDKTPINIKSTPVNKDIASWKSLKADQLIEDYKNGKLKGKLKEIAATLEEESNPVIMLIKHKK